MRKKRSIVWALMVMICMMSFTKTSVKAVPANGAIYGKLENKVNWVIWDDYGLSIMTPGTITKDFSFKEYKSQIIRVASVRTVTIGDETFLGYDQVKKVIFTESDTKIGDKAFADCINLETVEIPDKVLNTIDVNSCFKNTKWLLHRNAPITGSQGSCVYTIDANGNMAVTCNGSYTFKIDEIIELYKDQIKSIAFSGSITDINIDDLPIGVKVINNTDTIIRLPQIDGYCWCNENDITEPIYKLAKGSAIRVKDDLKKHYTITFDGNGATAGKMNSVKAEVGSEISLPKNVFSKDGYIFAGWEVIRNAESYGEKSDEDVFTYSIDEVRECDDILLKAIWKEQEKKNVSFNSNGGKGIIESLIVATESTIILPDNSFEAPNGKEFSNWEINETAYNPGDSIIVNTDIEVKAIWKDKKKQEVSIFFYPNSGSGTMPSIKVNEGENFTLPDNRFVAPYGKEFDSWEINGTNYGPGYEITVSETTYIYAVWRDVPKPVFNVCFYSNGGSGIMATVGVRGGNAFSLPDNGFIAPAGKEFDHWDINSKTYHPGEVITVNEMTNIYAVWKDSIEPTPEKEPEKESKKEPAKESEKESEKEPEKEPAKEPAKEPEKEPQNNQSNPETVNEPIVKGLAANEEIELPSGIRVKASSDASSVLILSIKSKKSVNIPSRIIAKEKDYPVTQIKKKAVTGKKVKKISIDVANLTKVDKNAFKGAKNLQKVTIKGTKKRTKIAKQIEKAAKKANKKIKIVYK